MVVVAIMAILAVAGLMGFMAAQRRSRDSARKGDIRSIITSAMSSATSGNFSFTEMLNNDALPADPSGNYRYLIVAPQNGAGGGPFGTGLIIEQSNASIFGDITSAPHRNFLTSVETNRNLLMANNSLINGGFACAVMESGTGGNAAMPSLDANNYFATGTTVSGDVVYAALIDAAGPILATTGNTNTYTVNTCTTSCNVFCMAF